MYLTVHSPLKSIRSQQKQQNMLQFSNIRHVYKNDLNCQLQIVLGRYAGFYTIIQKKLRLTRESHFKIQLF